MTECNIDKDTWQALGPWGAGNIIAIAIDPNNSLNIYISVWKRGIYKSTDGGINWVSHSSGLIDGRSINDISRQPLSVLTLAIDPQNSHIIYAGTWQAGLFKSQDSGVTWKQAIEQQESDYNKYSFHQLGFNINSTNVLFAATTLANAGYVLKSIDSGKTWATQTQENGYALSNDQTNQWSFQTVSVSALDPDTAYVGASKSVPTFYTKDSGDNWKSVDLFNQAVTVIKCDLFDRKKAYAGTLSDGMFLTENNGHSWSLVNNGLEPNMIIDMALHPVSSQEIYCATPMGVYVSKDAGVNWNVTGLTQTSVVSLVIDPNDPHTLYAGTGYPVYHLGPKYNLPQQHLNQQEAIGLLKSTDSGINWEIIAENQIPAYNYINKMVMDPNDPQIIYIITSSKLMKTVNAGMDWVELKTNDKDVEYQDLVIDPNDSQVIYLATVSYGVYRSTDQGRTWSTNKDAIKVINGIMYLNGIKDVAINSISITPSSKTIYVSTQINGILKSTDNGRNWSTIGDQPLDNLSGIIELHIDPLDPEIIYVLRNGTNSTLMVSKDAGVNWTALLSNHLAHSFAIDYRKPCHFYAGIDGAILKSTDRGKSWSTLSIGLPQSSCIALVIHPDNSSILYASFECGGVYESLDEGESWQSFNDNMLTSYVIHLKIHPLQTNRLYAGTSTSGVFNKRI